MKKLMSLFAVVILLAMTTQTFAQTFGIKGGLNLANMLAKDDDETYSDEFEMNLGFHIGPTMEVPLNEMVSFETGLFLATKGYKFSDEEEYDYTEKLNLYYLDIPLTAKGTFDVGGAKVYGTFGPYIGVGLSGKSKYEVTFDGETESDEDDIEFGSDEDEDDLKRLDYGLTVGAGLEINGVQVGISYDFGLANVSSFTDYGTTANHRILKFSVGYKFGN